MDPFLSFRALSAHVEHVYSGNDHASLVVWELKIKYWGLGIEFERGAGGG